MPFRRLKKVEQDGEDAASADDLAEMMGGLGLADKPGKNRFRELVARRKAKADWSSSESSEDDFAEDRVQPTARIHLQSAKAGNEDVKVRSSENRVELEDGACQSRDAGHSNQGAHRHDAITSSSSGDVAGPSAETQRDDSPALVLGTELEFNLPGSIASRLYAHQVEGVRWLYGLFALKRGGILGDDMGLGKTLQCSAFIAGLLNSKLIRRVLIVAPKTLLPQWRKELAICSLESKLHELAPNSTQHERDAELGAVFQKPGILLTTYGMVQHNAETLCQEPNSRFGGTREEDSRPLWDLIILDEGHKIKNPKTIIAQQLRTIPTITAIIISGTPVQNNLSEMHALFDFVQPGLLGDQRFFKAEYEKLITRGNSKDATSRDRELANGRSKALRDRCAPYFLRREKKDILSSRGEEPEEGAPTMPKPQKLGQKNDLVIWLRLQPQQQRIYEAFLNSQAVKDALNQSQSALAALTVLKKVCVHPHLLSERAADAVAKGGGKLAAGKRVVTDDDFIVNDSEEEYETSSVESDDAESGADSDGGKQLQEDWAEWGEGANVDDKLREIVRSTGAVASCKSQFVGALIKQLQADGHRTLIFSQSRVMLDILGLLLMRMELRFLRIDGSLSGRQRQALVDKFQASDDIPVFLLTSQVGGLGLTLTKADRVVIVDPAWNPSTDDQSVDRAYRIGQSKDVVVYRLISCGTVEEKIYRRQVFKGGLSRRGTKEGNPFQYFTQQDLRDLFRVDTEELRSSITQKQLHELHAGERETSEALQAHLHAMTALPCFAGVSDHDLLYSKMSLDPAAPSAGPEFPATSGSRSAHTELPNHRQQATVLKARKPTFRRQGWAGNSDISDLLAKSLQLDDTSGGTRPPGADWNQQSQKPPPSRPAATVAELQEQLSRLLRLKKSSSLHLKDGGQQLGNKIKELETLLADAFNSQMTSSSAVQSVPLNAESNGSRPVTSIPWVPSDVIVPRTGATGLSRPEEKFQVGGRMRRDDNAFASSHRALQENGALPIASDRNASGGVSTDVGKPDRTTSQPRPGNSIPTSMPGHVKVEENARLKNALLARFPDDDDHPASHHRASQSEHLLAELQTKDKELKSQLRSLLDIIKDPRLSSKVDPDRYRQMKVTAKNLQEQRTKLKLQIASMRSAA